MGIRYRIENDLDPVEFLDVLRRSGLDARRPVDEPERVGRMVANADLILSARDDGRLIGVTRSLTDFAYSCYLADLAVDRAFQGQGVGRELIRRTHAAAGPETTLVLLSAPDAMAYYPHVGFEKLENAFAIKRAD